MSVTSQRHRELCPATDLLYSLVAKLLHFLKIGSATNKNVINNTFIKALVQNKKNTSTIEEMKIMTLLFPHSIFYRANQVNNIITSFLVF